MATLKPVLSTGVMLRALVIILATGTLVWAQASASLLVRDMQGRDYDVDAILASGRPVVLVFWQTWCPSCKKDAPELAHAVADYGSRMQFFGVISGPDVDIDDAEVRRTAREWGHRQPQIRDRDLALARRFEVTGTPLVVVLGPKGRVLYRGYRLPRDWKVYLDAPAAQAAS